MDTTKKIEMLEYVFELEPGTLTPETILADLEEYDSMSKLSLIVMMDEEFGKRLSGERILKFKTVSDILDFMA